MKQFKIISYLQFPFNTIYKIEYKGKNYKCNFNGGLPKLEGITLNESLRSDLADIIEYYFLNTICN